MAVVFQHAGNYRRESPRDNQKGLGFLWGVKFKRVAGGPFAAAIRNSSSTMSLLCVTLQTVVNDHFGNSASVRRKPLTRELTQKPVLSKSLNNFTR
jgi:hypothetical protein